MQKESFRNVEIARILNEFFIPVKVDRELNTALDSELQDFTEKTRNQGGWPLNVFITPEGYPLFATLYSPPAEFLQTLNKLQDRWQSDSAGLKKLANPAPAATPKPKTPSSASDQYFRNQFIKVALTDADMLQGGFGEKSKFPQSPQLAALLVLQPRVSNNTALTEFLKLTLKQMAELGLRDHIGGGFFRYTTDPDWQTPHFEKMLYDNAQLASVYLSAGKIFGDAEYKKIAFSTLDFMLAEMLDKDSGAFYSSLSAVDDKNREGAYYLWERALLTQLLSRDELALLSTVWALNEPARFDYGYLPMQRRALTPDEHAKLSTIYAKLTNHRMSRAIPKDTKRLAGLNGLALKALSEAAALDAKYREPADTLQRFLTQKLGVNGLQKGESQGRLLGPADLEDYAYVVAGLTRYAQLTGKPQDYTKAKELATQAWQKFYSPGGWKLTQHSLLAQNKTAPILLDGATPSPAAVLIESSLVLGRPWSGYAKQALSLGRGEIAQNVFWYASQIKATALN